mmetsp:Transcript_45981/g.143868  ORF Transcript_45981/g.143868 Transcript_45981/m.143868 type:complete len:358 (+) Transcript_45981:1224-2297(+)
MFVCGPMERSVRTSLSSSSRSVRPLNCLRERFTAKVRLSVTRRHLKTMADVPCPMVPSLMKSRAKTTDRVVPPSPAVFASRSAMSMASRMSASPELRIFVASSELKRTGPSPPPPTASAMFHAGDRTGVGGHSRTGGAQPMGDDRGDSSSEKAFESGMGIFFVDLSRGRDATPSPPPPSRDRCPPMVFLSATPPSGSLPCTMRGLSLGIGERSPLKPASVELSDRVDGGSGGTPQDPTEPDDGVSESDESARQIRCAASRPRPKAAPPLATPDVAHKRSRSPSSTGSGTGEKSRDLGSVPGAAPKRSVGDVGDGDAMERKPWLPPAPSASLRSSSMPSKISVGVAKGRKDASEVRRS